MRRLVTVFAACLLAFGISGCTDSGSAAESKAQSAAAESASEQSAAESKGKETKAAEESSAAETTTEQTAQPAAFQEQILAETDTCLMKITGIDPDNMWGYTVKLYIENKSADKTLMFSWDDTALNGTLCDSLWAKSIMPGSKSNEEVQFMSSSMKEAGITDVSVITGRYRIYDNDDWLADAEAEGDFTVYPNGEESAVVLPREVSGETLFDNESCKMVVTGYEEDSIWGFVTKVYLENKSDKKLMFSVTGATVNGFDCDPLFAKSVPAGKNAFAELNWLNDDFEKNGITEVTDLTLKLRVYDDNDYSAADIVSDSFSLNPQY